MLIEDVKTLEKELVEKDVFSIEFDFDMQDKVIIHFEDGSSLKITNPYEPDLSLDYKEAEEEKS